MIDGMVTVEVVPEGTTNSMLRAGKARRALLVVPVDGMTMGKVVELKNTPAGSKWETILGDGDLDFLRPMTMQTIARRDDIVDDDEAWEREARLIEGIVADGVIVKTNVVLTDEDNGTVWSFTMPKPTGGQVEELLGVPVAERD